MLFPINTLLPIATRTIIMFISLSKLKNSSALQFIRDNITMFIYRYKHIIMQYSYSNNYAIMLLKDYYNKEVCLKV